MLRKVSVSRLWVLVRRFRTRMASTEPAYTLSKLRSCTIVWLNGAARFRHDHAVALLRCVSTPQLDMSRPDAAEQVPA